MSTFFVLWFGLDGGVGLWIYLVVVGLIFSAIWGLLMWIFFIVPYRAALEHDAEKKADPKPD